VVAWLGHKEGTFAPGIQSRKVANQVAHHLLVSHGLALRALRAEGASARLGIVLNMAHTMPLTDSPEDAAVAKLDDALGRRWYADPLFKGEYPAEALAEFGDDAPQVQPGDMAAIATPLDFIGINYYSRHLSSAKGPIAPEDKPCPKTDMGWEIYPDGLRELLLTMHRDYKLPATYITENGGAFPDPLAADGKVHDADRTGYLATHIRAVGEALAQGVPMAGYMVWSLMDNFEWASGYAKRFGIVHVDYETLARTPKDSALWFRDLVSASRALRKTGA